MSPLIPPGGNKIYVPDNLYTALLAIGLIVVLLAAGLVTYLCNSQYQTIFTIAAP
jgi:hypothetical protein